MVIKKKLKFLLLYISINPFLCAAVVCAFLFYTDLIKLNNQNKFRCLFTPREIYKVEGKLTSSPVKTASSPFYSAGFKINKVYCRSGKEGQAEGEITVLLPQKDVEALFPGKLFSAALKDNDPAVFESGKYFIFEVEALNSEIPLFCVKKAEENKECKKMTSFLSQFRSSSRLNQVLSIPSAASTICMKEPAA